MKEFDRYIPHLKKQMLEKLKQNEEKGDSWKYMDYDDLWDVFLKEFEELTEAKKFKDITFKRIEREIIHVDDEEIFINLVLKEEIDEIVDVINILFMLWLRHVLPEFGGDLPV